MTGPGPGPGDDDEEVLVRPYLAGAARAAARPGDEPAEHDAGVRPYVVTGGRARDGADLPWETLVVATAQGRRVRGSFETGRVLRLCERTVSVAEVSAHLRLPIGVARILVSDLVRAGLLRASAPAPLSPADDVEFLERLVQGVAAL